MHRWLLLLVPSPGSWPLNGIEAGGDGRGRVSGSDQTITRCLLGR